MKSSELASGIVMGLIVLGIIFIFLRAIDIIQWHWFWLMLPIFIAVLIYVIMGVLAIIYGLEIY